MAKQLKHLPKIDRNPLLMLDIVEYLREYADMVKKEAAENGKPEPRGKLMKVGAFANDMEKIANAKIGTHERDITQ
jgi:hypothetical protein